MKIVIDIPEEMYINALNGYLCGSKTIVNAIKNGKPLPKGHGRLIDADELIKQLEVIANDEWNKQVGSSKGLEDAIDIVDDAPTIIEADKESDADV